MTDSEFATGPGGDARCILGQLERSLSSRVDSWAELDSRTADLLGVRPEDLQAFHEVLQALDRFASPDQGAETP